MEARQGYLHVVHPGSLATEEEVYVYSLAIEREAAKRGVRRVLIDARAEAGEERHDVRTALWRWLGVTRALDSIAIVARDTLAATRINMTALSQRLSIRAYDEPTTAVRWLTRTASGKSTGSFRALTSSEENAIPVPSPTPIGLRRAQSTPPPPSGGSHDPVVIPSAAPVPRSTGVRESQSARDSATRERVGGPITGNETTPVPAGGRRR